MLGGRNSIAIQNDVEHVEFFLDEQLFAKIGSISMKILTHFLYSCPKSELVIADFVFWCVSRLCACVYMHRVQNIRTRQMQERFSWDFNENLCFR